MRLDKYLKLTRLIKRREVAKVLISEGSVLVNSHVAKPSHEIKINDTIFIKLGRRAITIKVTDISSVVNKEKASSLYAIIKDELTTN